MQNYIFSFEKLDIWKCAKDLVIKVYQLTNTFPSSEKYALASQIRRAIVSVTSNIAEGNGRISIKEKLHFIAIAYGSLLETYNQLLISVELNYITQAELDEIKEQFLRISKMLNGLKMSFEKRLDD